MKSKEELTKIVIGVLDDMLALTEYPIDKDFKEEFEMDSLDQVEFIINTEKVLNISIPDDAAEHIHTIEQTVEYLLSQQV